MRAPIRASFPVACASAWVFARAVVVHPNILLMDEPFKRPGRADSGKSAHRPGRTVGQTASCRSKVSSWSQHNIEEAVLMCDRVLLFSSNPGRVASEIKIDLPQPRETHFDPSSRTMSTASMWK